RIQPGYLSGGWLRTVGIVRCRAQLDIEFFQQAVGRQSLAALVESPLMAVLGQMLLGQIGLPGHRCYHCGDTRPESLPRPLQFKPDQTCLILPRQADATGGSPAMQWFGLQAPQSFEPVPLVTIQLPLRPAPGKTDSSSALPLGLDRQGDAAQSWQRVSVSPGMAFGFRLGNYPDWPIRLGQRLTVACDGLPVQGAEGEAGMCPGRLLRQGGLVILALDEEQALWLKLLQQSAPERLLQVSPLACAFQNLFRWLVQGALGQHGEPAQWLPLQASGKSLIGESLSGGLWPGLYRGQPQCRQPGEETIEQRGIVIVASQWIKLDTQ